MFGDTFAFSLTYPQTVNRHGDQNQYPLRVCDLFLCRIQKNQKRRRKGGHGQTPYTAVLPSEKDKKKSIEPSEENKPVSNSVRLQVGH